MATILRSVHWTVLTGSGDPIALVSDAVEKTDFRVVSSSPSSIVVEVPRAMLKNRWGATITGTLSLGAKGTDIEWVIDGPGSKHYEHMVTIGEHMPEGSLDNHGIPEAVAKISLKMFGREEIRHLSNVLDRGEFVYAIGIGSLSAKMGIVALTDRRLIFLEKSIGSEDIVEFALGSIGAMSLGKKMGGETLTISHSGTSATITTLQPGQGDLIARKFRELKNQPQPTALNTTASVDPIAQIERLAELRDKGILSDEEFKSQKTQLLGNL
ncbi:SHOCT domain-containing protein [Nesterenkonia aurantiaca]|uniref:SHOCT domain-containing protein n=1 Tax=Nesterenkonia aurantiaca TaxID=1436010 RepID=UPI003EE56888